MPALLALLQPSPPTSLNSPSHFPEFLGKVLPESNQQEARKNLEKAHVLLKDIQDEFLTPLTLAEVYSYISEQIHKGQNIVCGAIENLTKIITAYEEKNNHKQNENFEIDENERREVRKFINQRKLLGRAHLLKGNIHYLSGQMGAASASYHDVIKLNKKDFYALFSLARVKQEANENGWKDFYVDGLNYLAQADALNRPEITSRGTILAWSVIASHFVEPERRAYYRQLFDEMIDQVHNVGNRKPLFFSPLEKKPVPSETLFESVRRACRAD